MRLTVYNCELNKFELKSYANPLYEIENVIKKLGLLENIMDIYDIDSVTELENILHDFRT